MKKKKRLGILFTACFILIAGILYTITYHKPWKEDVLLLEGNETTSEIAEQDCAKTLTKEEVEQAESVEMTEQNMIYVHVCGEVKAPGVYEVPFGTRLNAVVELAGGVTLNAATEYINLAQAVVDGQQYLIPSMEEVAGMSRLDADIGTTGGIIKGEEALVATVDGNININTATREELMTLSGIGEAKADAIIEYRESVSRYGTKEDVMKVAGIKESLFNKIKDKIVVN